MQRMSQYKYHKGMTMRFYPSYEQTRLVNINIGTAGFVYNRMVSLNNEKYNLQKTAGHCPSDRSRLDYVTTVLRDLSEFQNSIPFLYGDDIDSQCIANARANYQKAWSNYKKNPAAGVPVFHKKKYEGSYQTNPHYKNGKSNVYFTDRHHIQLPKLGRCRVTGSPKLMDDLFSRLHNTRFGTITISRDAVGRYFVSIQLASDEPFHDLLPDTGSMRGYDMNIENFYTDSDNNVISNPRHKRNLQEDLFKAQRRMSRRGERAKKDGRNLRGSKNYQKSRKKAAYINAKITAGRDDFQHVLSKREVESQDYLFVEDLKAKNLIRNKKLSYAISDAGWGGFHRKLEYKAGIYGKKFLKVPAGYTTQTCSDCGYVLSKDERLRLSDREWTCPSCGSFHLRDHNAAKVILSRGMALLGI